MLKKLMKCRDTKEICEKLQNMKVSFRRVCFCAEVDFKAVTSGCLQGEKQSDGTWLIQGDLVVPYSFGDIDVEFEAQFAE